MARGASSVRCLRGLESCQEVRDPSDWDIPSVAATTGARRVIFLTGSVDAQIPALLDQA